MLIVYLAFFPLIGLLLAIYLRSKNASTWLIDLNTTTTLRSLLSGSNGANKAFFQNEEVVCFHTTSTTMVSNAAGTSNATTDETSVSVPKTKSRLKWTVVEWLPTENFKFHQSTRESSPCEEGGVQPKPLLILFAWLFAKERHLDKYRSLYMERGFDVLTITVNVRDFLIPQSGSQRIAALILRFLSERREKYRAYIFHAFSVGAYQMGELFVLLSKDMHKQAHNETKDMLKGIIYDSALDIKEAPLGLSKATTNNALLQWGITTLMNAHLRLCYHLSTRHYITSSKAVKENKFGCPTLVFLSKDDEVANYEHQFAVIEQWRQEGVPVLTKCWDQSPHVSHFFRHPDEYRFFLDDFLKNTAKIL